MLKFLAVLLLIVLFFRSIGLIARFLFGGWLRGNAQREFRGGQKSTYRKPADGNVNIDFVPSQGNEKAKTKNEKKDFDGGEYVDFEEVK